MLLSYSLFRHLGCQFWIRSFIGVGKFRILEGGGGAGGARFRILGGQGARFRILGGQGGRIPSRNMTS